MWNNIAKGFNRGVGVVLIAPLVHTFQEPGIAFIMFAILIMCISAIETTVMSK